MAPSKRAAKGDSEEEEESSSDEEEVGVEEAGVELHEQLEEEGLEDIDFDFDFHFSNLTDFPSTSTFGFDFCQSRDSTQIAAWGYSNGGQGLPNGRPALIQMRARIVLYYRKP